MKKFLPLVLVLFLFGCGQHTKQNISLEAPKPVLYNTPAGDKIVFLEDYYRVYMKTIKSDYKNRNKIYEDRVQDSIFTKYFLKSEYGELVRSMLSVPIKDTAEMGNYISGITENHAQIEELITSALAECRKYLKNDSITVYILPANNDIRNKIQGMMGISSLTAGSKQILLTINPQINGWKEMLPYDVAREYNHAYWTKINFNKSAHTTLLDCLVSEGRADSYAHLIYPGVICPWTKVLSEKLEADLWNRIKPELQNQDVAFQFDVMFGSKNQYVYWGGYTLGYHIVQSALKNHPELTPEEWTNLAPEKILAMSDYK